VQYSGAGGGGDGNRLTGHPGGVALAALHVRLRPVLPAALTTVALPPGWLPHRSGLPLTVNVQRTGMPAAARTQRASHQ
jgi:hypothetical protein